MENQTRNNTVSVGEADELRQQLALFKQRLDQQEIINERLMRRSMDARLNIFTRTSVIMDILGLLFMPIILVALHAIGMPWYLGFIVLLAVVAELAYNVRCHRQMTRLFTQGNDLLTVRRGLLRFKRMERLQMLISVPLILLWLLAFYWQMGIFSNSLSGGSAVGIVISAIGVAFGLLFCFGFFAWEMHRVNLSIREIDEFSAG